MSAITVEKTSDEPINGAIDAGAAAAIPGKTSTATLATTDSPMTSVRRASSRRELIT
jgi:hypothetical protein